MACRPNAQTPTVQEWRFTVEHQLSHETVLRVAYIGSHGYYGLVSVDPNDIPGADLPKRDLLHGRRNAPGTHH